MDEKSNQWLTKIKPFNQYKIDLNVPKSAILVIDMQKFFLDPDSPIYTCGGLAILSNIKNLISAFRHINRPVIYTCHVHHPNLLDAGIMEWW